MLFEDDYVVVARRDHPTVRGAVSVEAYVNMDHVLVTLSGDLVGIVDRALTRKGLKRRIVAGLPYFMPVLAIVSRTDVIATMPRRHAEAYAADFGLQTVEPPVALRRDRVDVVWHSRNAKSGLIQWVVDGLVAMTLAPARGQKNGERDRQISRLKRGSHRPT
jgi:DNA-binding transcriptional LysR family regulator